MDLAIAALIVAGAALVRGATGFGFAIIAAPALAFIWPTTFTTSLVLMLDVVATAMILRSGVLKDLRRDDALTICGGAFFGVVVGVFVIKNLPPDAARLGLDITVLVSALAALFKLRVKQLAHWSVAVLVGFLVGAMIGAFAIGGTLVVAWLMTAGRTPKEMRALLTVVFGLTDTFSVILRVALGLFPMHAAVTGLMLAPVMIAGILLGGLAFHRAPVELWRRGVAILLILIASLSLTHTLLSANGNL